MRVLVKSSFNDVPPTVPTHNPLKGLICFWNLRCSNFRKVHFYLVNNPLFAKMRRRLG